MIAVEVGRVVMSVRCLVCRCADAAVVQTQYSVIALTLRFRQEKREGCFPSQFLSSVTFLCN